MADEVDDERVVQLRLIPFRATRNFYGPQLHSFTADIKLDFDTTYFNAQFIRAPGVEAFSAEVNIFASYDDNAVMIGFGQHLA